MPKVSMYIVPDVNDPNKCLFTWTPPEGSIKKHGSVNIEEGSPVGPTAASMVNGSSTLAMAGGTLYAELELDVPQAVIDALLGG